MIRKIHSLSQDYAIVLGKEIYHNSVDSEKITFLDLMLAMHLWDDHVWQDGAFETENGLKLTDANKFHTMAECLADLGDGIDPKTCDSKCKVVCDLMEAMPAAVKDPTMQVEG